MAELRRDPEWVRQDAERKAEHQAKVQKHLAEMKLEMDPLIIALREAGFDFGSLSDFVNTDQSYPAAVPIFLKHLPNVRHPTLRKVIARALTVKEARGLAGPILTRELSEKDDEQEVKWTLANALTVAADRNDLPELELLLAETRDEAVRERLEKAMSRLRRKPRG